MSNCVIYYNPFIEDTYSAEHHKNPSTSSSSVSSGSSTSSSVSSAESSAVSSVSSSETSTSSAQQWPKRLGGTDANGDSARGIIVDSSGNIIITGWVYGDADLNGDGDSTGGGAESAAGYGGFDIILIKYDSSANFLWAKRFGGANTDYGRGIAVDSFDNIIIVGSVNGDADMNGNGNSTDGGAESSAGYGGDDCFIIKLDSSGSYIWSKRLGGTSTDQALSVAVDFSNNSIVVTGDVIDNADLNGDSDTDDTAESGTGYGNDDIFITKFDSNGNNQFRKRLGSTLAERGSGIAVDTSGNIIVTGYTAGDADLNGDGDTADTGESSADYGSTDVFISKFSSSGTYAWSRRLGGTQGECGYSVKTDSGNNVIIFGVATGNADMNGDGDSTDGGAESGTGYGSEDIFISYFNSSGTNLWSKRLGSTNIDYGRGLAIDSSDNVIVTGYVNGNADLNGNGVSTDGGAESAAGYGSDDIFVSKFNSSGTFIWTKRLGGSNNDNGFSIYTDSALNIYVTGNVNGNADLNGNGVSTDGGAESAAGYGGNDIFISVFTP